MGLSDDQRAMLRLLAQRGEQGYEDIAALKGLSVDEVRAQVAQALAQLDEEGALSATSPAEPEAPKAPEPTPPASEPAAAPPPPPRPPASPAPPKAKKARPQRSAPKLSMPSGSGLRAAIAAGIAVVALIAIVLIVGGGGDGEPTAGSTSAVSSGGGNDENVANPESSSNGANSESNPNGVTKAVLKAVDGSDAKGVAIFGKVDKGKTEKLALEVAIEGLEPSASGTSYTIWLSQSPQRMLPLVSTPVAKTGKIAGQFEVPVEVLAYLASETFKDLVVTRTTDTTLEAALKKATKEERAPSYTGEEVLRGTVTGPVVGAQIRQEELEKAKEGAE
jgi:hypothetical protein